MILKFSKELHRQGIVSTLMISDAYRPNVEEDLRVNIIYLCTGLKGLFSPALIPLVNE